MNLRVAVEKSGGGGPRALAAKGLANGQVAMMAFVMVLLVILRWVFVDGGDDALSGGFSGVMLVVLVVEAVPVGFLIVSMFLFLELCLR